MTDGICSLLSRVRCSKQNRGVQPNMNERECLPNSGGIGNISPVPALTQASLMNISVFDLIAIEFLGVPSSRSLCLLSLSTSSLQEREHLIRFHVPT